MDERKRLIDYVLEGGIKGRWFEKREGGVIGSVHEDYKLYQIIGLREFNTRAGYINIEYSNGCESQISLDNRYFDREATTEEVQRSKEKTYRIYRSWDA